MLPDTFSIIFVLYLRRRNMNNNKESEFYSLLNDKGILLSTKYSSPNEPVIINYEEKYYIITPQILTSLLMYDLFDEHMQKIHLLRDYKMIERLDKRQAKLEEDLEIAASMDEDKPVAGIEHEYVYFVKQNRLAPIKIGKTNNLDRKIRDLSASSPYGVSLLGYIKTQYGAMTLKATHELFSEYRINYEWFDISKKDVEELLKQYNNN